MVEAIFDDKHVLIKQKDLEYLIFHACGECKNIFDTCIEKCQIKDIALEHALDVNKIARESE